MANNNMTPEIFTGDWPADEQRDATLRELMIHGFTEARDAFSECVQSQPGGFPKELIPHFPYLILALEMTNGFNEANFQEKTGWKFWEISQAIAHKFCTIYRVLLNTESSLPIGSQDWAELVAHGHRVLTFYVNHLQKKTPEEQKPESTLNLPTK